METFAQQLSRRRRERAMTQEQLAKEMNVSRQTISHWENGRAVPDIDTIKKLSQVLDFNFLAAESAPADGQPAPGDEPAVRSRGAFIVVIVGALIMAVMLTAVLITMLRPAAPEKYSQLWYMQAQQPVAGETFVDIIPEENPVRLTKFDEFEGGEGWFYHFSIVPRGDKPFTIDEAVLTVFNGNGSRGVTVHSAADIQGFMGTNVASVESPIEWTGGFPRQDALGVGMLVRGMDADGNAQEYYGYVSLSQELKQN